MHAGYSSLCVYGVHNDSIINLTRGIVERVLFVRNAQGELVRAPQPLPGVFTGRLRDIKRRLLGRLPPTTVIPRGKYHEKYSGRKQQVYLAAEESLVSRPVEPRDAYVKTFVKAEKINFTQKGDPAPRVIQPRSPRYNVSVGRFLKPFEKALCEGFRRMEGYPVILKGMNANDVGTTLRKHWDSYRCPVAVGLDASRFDQHVSVQALEWEHGVYNAVFRDKELARLLRWQLHNVGNGRARDGFVRYKVDGCRMSGDINTGMGNCLLMSSIVLAYCQQAGLDVRLANNGDDCVLIMEKRDLPKLDRIDKWFLEFGFTLTREDTVSTFEQIEFCQAHPVWVGDGWRMCRNPFTALVKDQVSLLSWATEKEYNQYRNAVAECGLALTRGVPVWQAFYECMWTPQQSMHASGRVRDSGFGYMASGVTGGVLTDEARVSFWRAFGITPSAQEALESMDPGFNYAEYSAWTKQAINNYKSDYANLLAIWRGARTVGDSAPISPAPTNSPVSLEEAPLSPPPRA